MITPGIVFGEADRWDFRRARRLDLRFHRSIAHQPAASKALDVSLRGILLLRLRRARVFRHHSLRVMALVP